MTDITDDRFLGGRVLIRQPRHGYRAGVDPVLLAATVPARRGETVLDLGTGVGTAMICLGARVTGVRLTGVERQPDLATLATENLTQNGMPGQVITADLSDLPAELKERSFDHVIANPPYFLRTEGTASEDRSREAGRGEATPLSIWIDVATRRLAPGGRLTMILRAARLPDLLRASDHRIGSLVIRPIASRQGRDAELVIVSARKGGRTDARIVAPFILHEGDRHDGDRDSYTGEARAILRDGAALPL